MRAEGMPIKEALSSIQTLQVNYARFQLTSELREQTGLYPSAKYI